MEVSEGMEGVCGRAWPWDRCSCVVCVCVLTLSLGSWSVQAGVWVLKDRRRNKLCGICWAKLATKRGDPRIVAGRRVCLPCRMDEEDAHTGRCPIVTISEAVACPAPPAATPSAPVVPVEWEAYRWCILQGDAGLQEWSSIMYELIRKGGVSKWNTMRGGFLQHDTTPQAGVPESTTAMMALLHRSIEIIGLRLLSDMGVDSSDYCCREMDILAFPPKHSTPQRIHMDVTDHAEALQCYQLVVYLTPEGTISTAFVERHPDELLECWGKDLASHARDAAAHQAQLLRDAPCGLRWRFALPR